MIFVVNRVVAGVRSIASAIWRAVAPSSELTAALADSLRTRSDLLVENELLRHQIVVLHRQVRRPRLTLIDRLRLLLAARLLPGWRRAIAMSFGHATSSQGYDLLFRPVFLFFLVHVGSRRIVHIAATRNPSHDWTTQQIRNVTMDGTVPRFLIRDRDDKFGATFDRAAQGVGIRVIKTAVRAPNMNGIAERFAGSLRREMLDHVLVVDGDHLARIAREYAAFFNRGRPHQGIGRRVPDGTNITDVNGHIVATPVLGGLHHDYRRAA